MRAALVALVLAGCPGTVSKPRDLPSTPAAPEGSEPAPHVALLAAAGWRTCAVLSDGALWCWGYLMDGIADTPFAIATPRPVKRIALGLQHECVLGDDERVACRGNGRATTLAESEHARAFQYVEGLPPIVDVAAGIEETYVLTRDGRVFEWGEFSGSRRSKVPSEVKLPGRASAIAAADSHACALVAGDLWCWGRFRGRPERLGGSPRVTSMAVGQFSACGLDADHRVYCWGAPCDPLADELGGDACAIDALEGASELGGGWRKGICARFADGWRCIGDNEAGNVSARGPQWAREPLRAGPEHLATLAMGERHACGVDRDGAVLCWGNPYVSGHDEAPFLRERYRLPQSVTRPGQVAVGRALVCVNGDVAPTCWHAQGGAALIVAAAGATGIAAADARACALRDGALICWQHDETTTARVDALDARTLALASEHLCAIVGDAGELYCSGQSPLVEGYRDDQHTPVPTGVHARAVAAGGHHICWIDDGVACRGWNNYGQLGSAEAEGEVAGMAEAREIGAGEHHTCALVGAEVFCWGAGGYGQLGTGSWDDSATPLRVAGLPSIAHLAIGRYHSCALSDAGEAWCWGKNSSGELGVEDRLHRARAVAVRGIGALTELVAGEDAMCGVGAEGAVTCWGAWAETVLRPREELDAGDPLRVAPFVSTRRDAPFVVVEVAATAR